MKRVRVWDLPVRLFHGLLVLAVLAAFVSEKAGNMDVHAVAGLAVLGLVVFRVAWGFVGTRTARFASFVRGPAAIRDYLAGRWHGEGHNPLGALSVLAILAVLLLQALTGLVANDDSSVFGPLYDLVSRDTSDLASRVHRLQEFVILGLVLLHVAAIVFYVRVKKQDLLRPMLTGWRDGEGESTEGGGALAFVLSVAIAVAAVYAASGALLPPPPPPEAIPPPPDW